MEEHEQSGACDGKSREHQRHAGGERRCRDQYRTEKQKRKGILQPAGQEQEDREHGDVERQQPCGAVGLEPLGDAKTHAQHHIEPGGESNHRKAGPDWDVEFQTVLNDQNSRNLPDHGKPAQAQKRVQPHAAAPLMVLLDREFRHARSYLLPLYRIIISRIQLAAALGSLRQLERGPLRDDDIMNTVEPAIAVHDLVKTYPSGTAVAGISFDLTPGSITGLLGGNGAGKTTTIAMLMGLVTPTSGSVRVLAADMPRQRYRVLHRMNFESPYVEMPMRLTVRQNLTVFAMLYGVADVAGRIARLAAELDLIELLDRQTGKLSAGQKTRVSLAKALLNEPVVLLLDEPTASLDPDTADWVRGRLERYRVERGATVLLASHNMSEVERLCERVIIMKQGRIEDDDTPERLLVRYGRPTLEEVFLDVARGRAEAREAAQ